MAIQRSQFINYLSILAYTIFFGIKGHQERIDKTNKLDRLDLYAWNNCFYHCLMF